MTCAFPRALLILSVLAWCQPLKAESVSRTPPKFIPGNWRMDEFHLAVFQRGDAGFHLGDWNGAKQDLELLLRKALDAAKRPDAQRLLARIAAK